MKVLNQRFSLKELSRFRGSILNVILKKKRLWNLFLVYLSYFLKRTKVWGLPTVVMLEPSSKCNLKCPFCPKQLFPTSRIDGNMNLEDYKKLIRKLSPTAFILALWNYGEPFLNKNIIEMIAFAKSQDMGVVLSTNATLLNTESTIDSLIDSGLDHLIISMDGATKETYEKYRVGAVFEDTIRNIQMLTARRSQKNKISPFINLQFLVLKENQDEINEISKLACSLKVDRLSLKKVYYAKNQMETLLPKDKRYICDFYYRGNTQTCTRPFTSTVINWNGDILPCCSDVEFKYIMGNAFQEENFKKIWNGKKYQEFRKTQYENPSDHDICQNCGGRNFDDSVFMQVNL